MAGGPVADGGTVVRHAQVHLRVWRGGAVHLPDSHRWVGRRGLQQPLPALGLLHLHGRTAAGTSSPGRRLLRGQLLEAAAAA